MLEEWTELCVIGIESMNNEKANIKTATNKSGKICIAIWDRLSVFEDHKFTKLLFSCCLMSNIDCCKFVEGPNVILVATQNGTIFCFNMQGHILFERTFPVKDPLGLTFVDLIVEVSTNQGVVTNNAIIISSKGMIFRLHWQHEPTNVKPQITIDVETELQMGQISSVEVMFPGERNIALVGEEIVVWNGSTVVDSCSFLDYGQKPCTKAKVWKDKFLVCLTSDGELVLICMKTLLCCGIWKDFLVEDFLIANDECGIAHIVMLTKIQSFSEERLVLKATIPDFNIIQKVQTTKSSWLIMCTPNIMCVEEVGTNGNDKEMRIVLLSHCQPDQRLQILLKQHEFVEAEAFASQFNLDKEIIWKERAVYYMNTLSVKHDSEVFNYLMSDLEKISDIHFIASFCEEQGSYDIGDMKNLICYGLQRMEKHSQKGKLSAPLEKIHMKLYSRLHVLETLVFIKGHTSFNAKKRKNILNINWLKLCFSYLANNEIEKASFIWLRHLQNSSIEDEEKVKHLYGSLSSQASKREIFIWMELIIPYILQNAPHVMEHLMQWIIEKASLMEKDDEWPSSAICFVEDFCSLMKEFQKSDEENSFNYFCEPKENMHLFLLALKEIQQLKDHYDINIPLCHFLQDDKLLLATNVLNKLIYHHKHDIPKGLNGILKPFTAKYNLSMDSVISQYFKNYVTMGVQVVGYPCNRTLPSEDEEVIAALIRCIVSLQDKIDCILAALQLASIPWSATMRNLAAEGCSLNHPHANKIKKVENLAKVRLVLKKYKFTVSLLECSKFAVSTLIIRRIIKEAKEEMLEDALTIAHDSTQLRTEVFILILHHYILHNQLEDAEHFLNTMDPKMLKICVGRILCRIEVETDVSLLYLYINFMNVLSSRQIKISGIEREMEYIKNMYCLNFLYGFQTVFKKFTCVNERHNLLELWIRSLVTKWKESSSHIDSLYRDVKFVAELCFLPRGDGFLKICDVLQECQGEEILGIPFTEEKLKKQNEENIIKMCRKNIVYSQLMTNTVVVCPLRKDEPWLYVLPWINRVNNASRGAEINGIAPRSFFRSLGVFSDHNEDAWKPEILRFIQIFFQHQQSNQKSESPEIMFALTSIFEENCVTTSSVILIMLLNMCKYGIQQISSESTDLINSYLLKRTENLLSELIVTENFDFSLAAGMLFSMEHSATQNFLSISVEKFRNKFKVLERVVTLGHFYCTHKQLEGLAQLKELHAECKWARYFRKRKLNYNKSLIQDKSDLVRKLICLNEIEIAENFCNTFQIDFYKCLCESLEFVVLSWEPEYEIKVNEENNSTFFMKNNESEIVKKCLLIAQKMEKSDVKYCLNKIEEEINYYYYEEYFCIDKVRQCILNEETSLPIFLLFLKNYQRISPVQDEELDIWISKYPYSQGLPEIAKWRLPFCPNDMTRVVNAELTLNNYELWLEVANLLKIQEDHIRCLVLRDISNMFEQTGNVEADHQITFLDEITISQIKKCAAGMARQELSCAALFHACKVAKHPMIKNQLALMCYEFAKERVVVTKTEAAMKALEKVKNVCVASILTKYGLGEPYLGFQAFNPEILIRELYNHPDIVKRPLCFEKRIPDIHGAVHEIVKVHVDVQIKDLLLNIIQEWLDPKTSVKDRLEDSSFSFGNVPTRNNIFLNECDNLTRASYLLKKEDSSSFVAVFLVGIIFADERKYRNKFKFKALVCLLNTFPMKTVCKMCGRSAASVRHYLQTLFFTSALECLGYRITISEFENCRKDNLVSQLISSGNQNCAMLSLAMQLSLKYGISNPITWQHILKCMVQNHMLKSLKYILVKLPANISGIIEAWSYVLFDPFRSCCTPMSDYERKSCEETLNLLFECPVTGNLDLLQIAQFCFCLESPEWAALIVHFLNPEEQQKLTKKILSVMSIDDVILKLRSFAHELVLARVRSILEEQMKKDCE